MVTCLQLCRMQAEEHLEAHLEVVCPKKLDMALVDIAAAPPDKVEAGHPPA